MKVVIYNDCHTGVRHHFGCDLVISTFKEQLDRVGVELLGTISMNDKSCNNPILGKADLVIVNGEGSFHHNNRNDIATVSHRYPSILINTVFEDNNVDLGKFKFISARESRSAKNIGCPVIPDIIFTSKRLEDLVPTREYSGRVMHSSGIRTLRPAKEVIPDILRCSSIETESFHGIAVATILGIPVTKILPGAGVRWKTESLYSDIQSNPNYLSDAKDSINALFDRIHEF